MKNICTTKRQSSNNSHNIKSKEPFRTLTTQPRSQIHTAQQPTRRLSGKRPRKTSARNRVLIRDTVRKKLWADFAKKLIHKHIVRETATHSILAFRKLKQAFNTLGTLYLQYKSRQELKTRQPGGHGREKEDTLHHMEEYLDDDIDLHIVEDPEGADDLTQAMQTIDDQTEYDKLKQQVRQRTREVKQQLKLNKLDDIAEANCVFEESNAFTSAKFKSPKYLVMLLESAWINYQNRKKAKHMRKMVKGLPAY